MSSRVLAAAVLLLAGCSTQPAPTAPSRFSRVMASLMDAAEKSRAARYDSARAAAAADSVFSGEGTTRAEFLREAKEMNGDIGRWRGASEGASRELETRLAGAGRAR